MLNPRRLSNIVSILLAAALLVGGYSMTSWAQDIQSGDGMYAAKIDVKRDRKVVYRVGDGEEWYTIPNIPGQIFLSQDGTYTAVCEQLLSSGYKKNAVVVQFYRTDVPLVGFPLMDLLSSPKKLRREGTGYRWGKCAGFTDGTNFAVDTIESRRFSYNPATGQKGWTKSTWPPPEQAAPSQPTAGRVVSSTTWIFLSQLQEPGGADRWCNVPGARFCDDFVNGIQNGWQQARGKWIARQIPLRYRTSGATQEWALYQRSDLQREGNSLMYYDPENFSDFELSTVIRMDFEVPQVTLQEDDQRLRRMRRIAGAGLIFRFRDVNNYYMFRLAGEEGAVLGKMVNGEWFDLANPRAVDFLNSNLRYSDRIYGLRVRVRGTRIECFITEKVEGGDAIEQAVISLRDDSFSIGRIGVVTFEAKADFLFVRIEEL